MKILTFQNYNVVKELNKVGIFESKLRREWVEEPKGAEAVQMLCKRLSRQVGFDVHKCVFGIKSLNIEFTMAENIDDLDSNGIVVSEKVEMNIDSMSKFVCKYTNILDELIGVTTLCNATVLMCLDVPDEYVLAYNQGILNAVVKSSARELTDGSLDLVLDEFGDVGITSCILPYIKKEWVEGVYTFVPSHQGGIITLKLNDDSSSLELYSAYNSDMENNTVVDVTKDLIDYEFTVEEVLESFDTYTGWECQDEFNMDLFLEFLTKITDIPINKLLEYNFEVDTEDVFESIIGIMDTLYSNL